MVDLDRRLDWDHCPECGSSDDDDLDPEGSDLSLCHELNVVSECGDNCNHD